MREVVRGKDEPGKTDTFKGKQILIVEDEAKIREAIASFLERKGAGTKGVSSLREARQSLIEKQIDAVILDLNLPDGHGLDWISEIREAQNQIAIVVITGEGGIPLAVEAMKRGADHFLPKPVKLAEIEICLRKSLEVEELRRGRLKQERLQARPSLVFGKSKAICEILETAGLVAATDTTVLLQGETGSGKGVFARWLHEESPRSRHAFVEVNCATLRGELLASELFGHAKGSFTTALSDRVGLIEAADGGTLFLDEIGAMDVGIQAQFLKVIEEKQFRRLGESKIRRSDFRLICATNLDLSAETQAGRFRSDLFFRIHVFPLTLPPLRERLEDIAPLAESILRQIGAPFAAFPSEILALLQSYRWPGNLRELRNVLERAVLLSRRSALHESHFPGLEKKKSSPVPFHPFSSESSVLPAVSEPVLSLEAMETRYIQNVVARFQGDTKQAADALGISRATLYRKLKKAPEEKGGRISDHLHDPRRGR